MVDALGGAWDDGEVHDGQVPVLERTAELAAQAGQWNAPIALEEAYAFCVRVEVDPGGVGVRHVYRQLAVSVSIEVTPGQSGQAKRSVLIDGVEPLQVVFLAADEVKVRLAYLLRTRAVLLEAPELDFLAASAVGIARARRGSHVDVADGDQVLAFVSIGNRARVVGVVLEVLVVGGVQLLLAAHVVFQHGVERCAGRSQVHQAVGDRELPLVVIAAVHVADVEVLRVEAPIARGGIFARVAVEVQRRLGGVQAEVAVGAGVVEVVLRLGGVVGSRFGPRSFPFGPGVRRSCKSSCKAERCCQHEGQGRAQHALGSIAWIAANRVRGRQRAIGSFHGAAPSMVDGSEDIPTYPL